MTSTVVVMIIVGIAFVIASFIISERIGKKEESNLIDLMTVDESYEFSDRELQIIKRKIEDVIANQAKDILYQTNESLSNMANEKTMALGDYAVAVCEEIENNHKQVMFLYSMLDDKQKEIMKTVKDVDSSKKEIKDLITETIGEQDKLYKILQKLKSGEYIQTAADNAIDKEKKQSLHEASQIKNNEEQIMQSQLNSISNEISDSNDHHKESKEPTDIDIESDDGDVESDDNKESENSETTNETMNESADESIDESIEDIFAEIDKTDIDFDEVLENDFKNDTNVNDIILEMYGNGNSIIDIAKEMGLGVGEVKLVIDLYQGD